MHSVDKFRLAGRGLGGERRPSRQEPGHRGAGRRTLSKLGVIDDVRDHLPAAVALHRYYERDVVSQMLQSITRTLAESNSSSSGARTKSAALI